MSDKNHRSSQEDRDREPGTREDGEAMPPAAIDPGIDERDKVAPADRPSAESVDEQRDNDKLSADEKTMVKDATGF